MTDTIKIKNAGLFGSHTKGKLSPEAMAAVATVAEALSGQDLSKSVTPADVAKKAIEAMEHRDLGAVLYSDGGCKPSRGIGGWGVHGYLYTLDVPKQGSGCQAILTNMGYVDDKTTYEELKSMEGLGSFFPRTQMTIDKIQVVTPVKYLDGYGSLIPISTNNIAELTAATNALRYAIAHGVKDLLLLTDSNYVIKGLTYCDNWEAQGWRRRDGEPVANVEEWIELLKLARQLRASGCNVQLEWVQGHAGDFGNTLVDAQASRCIIAGRKGLEISEHKITEAKGYWTNKVSYNKLLNHPYWYFNTHVGGPLKSPDDRVVYFVGDHGTEDEFIGKKVSDAGFAVLYFKESDPVLERLTTYQDELDKGEFSNVIVGRLSNILSATNYADIQENGTNFLHTPNFGRNDVCTANDVLLTRELRPPLTAFRLAENLSALEEVLRNHLDLEQSIPLVKTDITSMFYAEDKSAKKPVNKLLPSINNAVKKMDVVAAYDTGVKSGEFKIPITFGLDVGIRNLMSGIAEQSPTVTVVTWRESDQAFRYGVVIETVDDAGIWASVYSNICLLPG